MPTIGCGHWNGRRNRLPQLLDQSFGEVGGAGGFACRWKLISIAHPNPENGYALRRRPHGVIHPARWGRRFACRSNGHNQWSASKMNKFPKTVKHPQARRPDQSEAEASARFVGWEKAC